MLSPDICKLNTHQQICDSIKGTSDYNGEYGGIGCCNGEAFVCQWRSRGSRKGMDQCVKVHEEYHLDQADCPDGYVGRSNQFIHPQERDADECLAYSIGLTCLMSYQKLECGALNADCNADYMKVICEDCNFAKKTYHCSTMPPICATCKPTPVAVALYSR